MKKKIIMIAIVFICSFIKLQQSSAIDFKQYGKIGDTQSYAQGKGNHNGFQGFRITVCETNPSLKCNYRIDIHGGGLKQTTLYSSKGYSKLEYYSNIVSYVNLGQTSFASKKKQNDYLSKNYKDYLEKGTNLSSVFTQTKDGKIYATDFLKGVLSSAGYKCLSNGEGCNDGQIITIEPMFDLVVSNIDYFGTAFEMATVFNLASEKRGGLNFHSGTYNATYSMYLTKKYDPLEIGDTSLKGKVATNVSYAAFSKYLRSNYGNGINIYEVNSIVHPKSKGNLKIEKIDLNGKYLNGAVFDLYKGHCTGTPIKSKITTDNGSVTINDLEAGEYCIKETQAPNGYNIGSSKTVTVKSGETVKVQVVNTKITPKYTLTVNKYEYVNGQKTTKYVSGALMWVYKSPCGSVNTFVNGGRTSTEPLSFKLDGNATYCVVETNKPSGYVVPSVESSYQTCEINNETYYCKDIYLNGNKTLDFYNEKTCTLEFDTIKSQKGIVSMESRIELYNKYKLNKLLNMNNNTSSSACSNEDDKALKDKYKYNLSCFDLKLNNQIPFDSNNLTYYSEIANIDGKTAYCLTTLDVTTSGGIYNSVTSGRQVTYGSAPLATVRKVCYTYNINNINTTTTQLADDISSYFPLISMKKYIKTFTNSNLIENYEYINKVNDKVKFSLVSKNGNRYEYVMKDQYDYKDIILNYGTGQVIENSKCDGYCLNIGKGIMSRLTEKGLQTIKYQVNYNYYINGKAQSNTGNINCNYTANPKIINPKLSLQFEQIMNKKPFMNKEGTSFRNVSYNWWSKTIDYKNLNDLNGDGIVDDLDKIIKKYSNNRGESKSGDPKDNYLIDYVMNGRNNSYNSTKEGYRYKIVLTPSDIKKIRKYNDQVNNYNDNDIYCNNGTCSTEFIDNLRESKVCFKNICDSLSFKLDYAKQVYNIIDES